MASIIIGKTRPASKLNRSPIEQPFGDALWPRTTSLVGLPLLAGDLLAARAWPPVRGGSGVSMAAPAKLVASTIMGSTRQASKQDRSTVEQPFGDALLPRTTSLVGLSLRAGGLLAARAWPPVRGGSGVSMAAPAKRVASTIIGNTRRGSNQDTIGAPLSRDVAFWCVCIENAIDSALHSSGGRFIPMMKAMPKPRETSGTSLGYQLYSATTQSRRWTPMSGATCVRRTLPSRGATSSG